MKKEVIKPFDLAKAKAGAKLKTRAGLPVEIFKWDARGDYPIKGMVKEKEQDVSLNWTCDGSCYADGTSSNYDLVIVEEVETSPTLEEHYELDRRIMDAFRHSLEEFFSDHPEFLPKTKPHWKTPPPM